MWNFITLFGSHLLVLLIFAFYMITKDLNATFYLIGCMIVGEIAGNTTKIIFFKPRPSPMSYKNIIEKAIAGSFPSIHTLRICLVFLFSVKYCLKFSPIFFVLYILVAISRIKLKKHFFIDTVGGSIYAIVIFLIFVSIYSSFNLS